MPKILHNVINRSSVWVVTRFNVKFRSKPHRTQWWNWTWGHKKWEADLGLLKPLKSTTPKTWTEHNNWFTVLFILSTGRSWGRLRRTSLPSWRGWARARARAEPKVGLIGEVDFRVFPLHLSQVWWKWCWPNNQAHWPSLQKARW